MPGTPTSVRASAQPATPKGTTQTYYPANQVDDLVSMSLECLRHLSTLLYVIRKHTEKDSVLHDLTGIGTFISDNYIDIVRGEHERVQLQRKEG